jgi:hypothetical protein
MYSVPMGAANAGMLVRGARIEGVGYTLYPHTGVRLLRNPGATTRSRKTSSVPPSILQVHRLNVSAAKPIASPMSLITVAKIGNNNRLLTP